jgi:alkylation response protein AidB-like acyl-CoA dehydrogenase
MYEEFARAGVWAAGQGIVLHNDTLVPYFLSFADEAQKRRWLPGIVSGESITALAMTEPGAGSDVAGLTTSAVRRGESYVVNGAKTFITNGINSDLVVTAVTTDPAKKHRGITLLVIERGMAGFDRGRRLDKIGLHAQDTAELFFRDVEVPVTNRLGVEGAGFTYLMTNLAQERMSLAACGTALARQCLDWTIAYVKERKAFGHPIGQFQNSQFLLAQLATEVTVGEAFLDQCVVALNRGELDSVEAAMAKLWCTQLQNRVADACLQLFGGYGYMTEYPIGRAFVDSRVATVYGGTSEVMKEIIGRSLGL